MASVKLSLTPDCRLLTYHLTGSTFEGTSPQAQSELANIEFYNNGTLVRSADVLLSNVEADNTVPGIEVSANQFTINIGNDDEWVNPGIITIVLQDSMGNRASAAILSSCELDCCLAEKVLDLTKCTDCNSKCSDKLAMSQKIFLYLTSIKTMLSQLGTDVGINEGIISQALDTYNAAKDLCSDSCGCNC
jgi:hypothetical protein|tara:strand:- start:7918 stop:8487 length:570 start_codon:yes stop_codon:yes gene_type:complete